jgi:predicted membrane-bound spermidine synthase
MSPSKRTLYILISVLFFLSGFASLIYQIVWQRLLSMHYGVGSISIALIVGIYMAGLGLGALIGGFLAERLSRKISVYFWLEISIGIFGLLSLPILNFLGERTAGSELVVSAVWMLLFLCFPTFLMGITLPFLTKIFNQYLKNFEKTVSYLYFINTIGASVGAFITSYFFLSFFGIDIAIFIAAGIDFFLAGLVYMLAKTTQALEKKEQAGSQQLPKSGLIGKWAYLVVGITGFLAIGYEIIWYRFIGVLIKDSPYAFSSILSVYLLGLALGSLFMNRWLEHHPGANKKKLFFTFQFLIGFFIFFSFISFFYLTRDTNFGHITQLSFRIEAHPDPIMVLTSEEKTSLIVPFTALFDVFTLSHFFDGRWISTHLFFSPHPPRS